MIRGHHPWRLDDRDARVAPERILARQLDHEIEALVHHLRERMGRIEADRCQQRPHFLREIARRPFLFRARELGAAHQPDAGLGQRRQHLVVEHAVLLGDQRARFLAHAGEEIARLGDRQPGRRHLRAQLLLDARDPDLEELVEIAADDAQEAQALEQRNIRVLRERQHAPVEVEQRQFAVDRRGDGSAHDGGRRRGSGPFRDGRRNGRVGGGVHERRRSALQRHDSVCGVP